MAQVKYLGKKAIYINTLVVFFFIADRVLKLLVLKGISAKLFFIDFSVFKNPYIAFSIPLSGLFFYILLSIILFFVISSLIKSYQKRKTTAVFGLSLILAGALSNILDRIFYSAVIDYVTMPFLLAFNIADTMIVAGVFILFVRIIRKQS